MYGMFSRIDGLRSLELGDPGGMRDRLNALVLAGEKTATAGLWKSDYGPEDEELEEVGERLALLGSDSMALAVLEVTGVEIHPFDGVPWAFAQAEGEGFTSIQDWREGHRAYYKRGGVVVADEDTMVCVWFQVSEVLPKW